VRRASAWSGVAAALFFLGLAVVELWTPIVHGGDYLPADLGQLSAITRIGLDTAQPKNQVVSDAYVDFGPFLRFDAAQVRAGHLPTWNPYSGNGQPYLADGQTVVLSPFTTPFYFLSFRLALIASALARLWLLGFFSFLFLVRHRLRTVSALVGATLFAYAGYHLVWLDYQGQVAVSATLPVALWCVRVALDHRPDGPLEVPGTASRHRSIRLGALLGLSVALATMVFDGHAETMAFDGALVVGYALLAVSMEVPTWRRRGAWLLRLSAAALLGVGLSAVQLFPFLQYSDAGARPAQLRAHPASSVAGFSPAAAPLMAFPNLLGAPQLDRHSKVPAKVKRGTPPVYPEANGNATGLLALCLLPLGVVEAWRKRREAIALFGLGAAVIGSFLLFTRIAGLWWHGVPLLGAAGLDRSQDVLLLGVAVLAALGCEWVLSRSEAERRRRQRTVRAMIVSFAFVSVTALIAGWNLTRMTHSASVGVAHIAFDNRLAELFIAGVFALVLALLALGLSGLARGAGVLALGALAFASNGLIMQSYNPTVKTAAAYPHTGGVRQLTKVIGGNETMFLAGSFPMASTSLWFGLYDIGSYDAIGLSWHDALYKKVFGVSEAYAERAPSCIEGLRLFGVRWVIGGGAPDGLKQAKLLGYVPAYEVPGASLVSMVSQSIRARGKDGAALREVDRCSFDPDGTVVLDPTSEAGHGHGHGKLGPARGSDAADGSAQVTARTPTALTVRTTVARAGWLVVRQTYAPGWQATVDGRAVTVRRADVAFQAVPVPAGVHEVRLTYDPDSVSDGALVSLLSVGVLLVLLGLAFGWRSRGRSA
jgi:hypothetical protein